MLKHIPFYASLLGRGLTNGTKVTTSYVLVYGAIEAHSLGEKGCIASNALIAEETGLTTGSVRTIISRLAGAGWVKVYLGKNNTRLSIAPLMDINIPLTPINTPVDPHQPENTYKKTIENIGTNVPTSDDFFPSKPPGEAGESGSGGNPQVKGGSAMLASGPYALVAHIAAIQNVPVVGSTVAQCAVAKRLLSTLPLEQLEAAANKMAADPWWKARKEPFSVFHLERNIHKYIEKPTDSRTAPTEEIPDHEITFFARNMATYKGNDPDVLRRIKERKEAWHLH